jgi:trimethylamine:corrinoid methyltransferase-like protein
MSHYQIEYYNSLWKDWIAFDQLFYKTEEQARKRANEYKKHKLKIKTRIIETAILDEKSKRTRSKNTQSVRVEQL